MNLTADMLVQADAFVGEPVKVDFKHPDTGEILAVYVKPQSIGDSLKVIKALGEHDMGSIATVWAAISMCILDDKGRQIITFEQIQKLKKESAWYPELLRCYLEVNADKKKA